MAYTEEELKKELETKEYEYGFYTDIESDTFPVGLNEDIIRKISDKKGEPEWMTDWRLEAYNNWKEMTEPEWANVYYKNLICNQFLITQLRKKNLNTKT